MLREAVIINFVVCVLVDFTSSTESRDIKITQGVVRGYKDPDYDLYAYYGIPYAKAPTGKNRFKAPLPAPVWSGTFEAVNENIVCPQDSMIMESHFKKTILAIEDCLITNVFVPDTKETNLPVVVYIHGGAFDIGSGNMIRNKNFVSSKKTIVVTINYRLGALGFLCLGSDTIPGNAGFKDQVAALRWVRDNIAYFGGNPDDVAIAGYSAGSFSVDILMLSKMAEGLFTKVIPESGANVGTLGMQIEPLKNAKEFAKRKGFTDVDNFKALEDFFTTIPWKQLIELSNLKADATLNFAACVERTDTEGEVFLSEAPYTILKNGNYKKVPILYGMANAEGLLLSNAFEKISKLMNEDFSLVLPADLQFETKEQRDKVAKEVKEFYFKDKDVGLDTLSSYIDYYSDTYFAIGMSRAIKLHVAAGNNEIYVYEFSYVDKDYPYPNPVPSYFAGLKFGADHCSQTYALLDNFKVDKEDNTTLSKEYLQVKATVRDLWYNFITKNKPVPPGSNYPSWPAADAKASPHMNINQKLELRGPFLKERMEFWHKIYDVYYKLPTPPPTPPTRNTEL